MKVTRWLILGTMLSLPATGSAQERPDSLIRASDSLTRSPALRLPEVVVTATRVPVASHIASASVWTGAGLRALGITRVADALSQAAGASVVQTGSFGGTTSLFLRGGQPGYTRVLLDGIPLNDPGGAFDFADLSTAGVDRIEVVRGPTSVLYGTDAVSGVVQLFTRRGAGPPEVSLDAKGGTYHTGSLTLSLAGGAAGTSYGLHLNRFQSGGIYAFNNAYRQTTLNGSVRVASDARTDVTLTVHYGDNAYHVPTDGNGQVVDHNAFQFGSDFSVGLDAGRFFTSRVEGRLQLSNHTRDGGFDNQPDSPVDTLGFYSRSLESVARRTADARVNLYLTPRTVVTVGGQVEHQWERSVSQSQSLFGTSSGVFQADRWNGAGYLQALGAVGRFDWSLGGRADQNQAFGTFGTYRVGAALGLTQGLRVRANLGTGFREPTFFENFANDFVRGNPDLRPERTVSWEVGLEQALGSLGQVRSTWFDQRFRNLIDFTFTPPDLTAPNYFNIAAARARGIELELVLRGPVGLSADLAYTYLHTRVTEPGFDTTAFNLFLKDQRLVRRPAHAGAVTVGFSPTGRLLLRLQASYRGARDDTDYQTVQRVRLPAYTTVQGGAEYTLVRRDGATVALTLSGSNLLDEGYEAAKGFRAPGRTLFGGVHLEF